MTRIDKYYSNIIRTDLLLKNKYKNIMMIPEINKVIMDIRTKENEYSALFALEQITGQKGILIEAKRSIASFHLKKGTYIACKVTLHGENMFFFLDKLVRIVFPRIREYRGVGDKNINNIGNITIAIKDISVFPEIEYQSNNIKKNYGININILVSNPSKIAIQQLLSSLQIPIKQ